MFVHLRVRILDKDWGAIFRCDNGIGGTEIIT
jgi:hypothetical protein